MNDIVVQSNMYTAKLSAGLTGSSTASAPSKLAESRLALGLWRKQKPWENTVATLHFSHDMACYFSHQGVYIQAEKKRDENLSRGGQSLGRAPGPKGRRTQRSSRERRHPSMCHSSSQSRIHVLKVLATQGGKETERPEKKECHKKWDAHSIYRSLRILESSVGFPEKHWRSDDCSFRLDCYVHLFKQKEWNLLHFASFYDFIFETLFHYVAQATLKLSVFQEASATGLADFSLNIIKMEISWMLEGGWMAWWNVSRIRLAWEGKRLLSCARNASACNPARVLWSLTSLVISAQEP